MACRTVSDWSREQLLHLCCAGSTEEQPAAELQQQQSLAEAGRRRSSKEARRAAAVTAAAVAEAGQQLRRASSSGGGAPEGSVGSQSRPPLRRGSGSGTPANSAGFQGWDSAPGQHRPEGDLWRLATVPEGDGASSLAASISRPQGQQEGQREAAQHPHARFANAASDDGGVRPNWRFSDSNADASGCGLWAVDASICLHQSYGSAAPQVLVGNISQRSI